jgi:predicted nuclease of restriction endonuclease-like (RecB) superfamily
LTKPVPKPSKPVAALPADYAPLLADIKARVQAARIKAGLAANRELLSLYWEIGRLISEAQRTKGYGKQVVEHLAADLQREFPGLAGFSPLNVWRMRAFYSAYTDRTAILSQPATGSPPQSIVSPLVTESAGKAAPVWPKVLASPPEPFASLPWGHNIMLLHKLEDRASRFWYAGKAVEHGWSRNVLALQIEAGLHTRQGKAVTNFKTTLPPAQSDLAQGITKGPYLFDFLSLHDAESVLA